MPKKPCKWTGKYVNEYGQEQINGKTHENRRKKQMRTKFK